MKISYRGTHYLGWQIQEKQGQTVQGEIHKALGKICPILSSKNKNIRTLAAGRTDAKVHALEQVFRLDIPRDIPLDIPLGALPSALNAHLPEDIRILGAELCPENFHPVRDALWKEYTYVFTTQKKTPFNTDMLAHIPYTLDLSKMKEGANCFVGKHDFSNYYCQGSNVNSTRRQILDCHVDCHSSSGLWKAFVPEYFTFTVRGKGFLKQMVRLMTGAILDLGRGKVTQAQLVDSLKGPLDKKLGPVAPPQGLYMVRVTY